MRRWAVIGIVVVLAGVTLAACGGSDDDADDGGSSSPPLTGTEWVLDHKASTLEVIAPSITVTARFEKRRLTGNSGCNNYTTSYELDGNRLRINRGIASTAMACAPPASNVEAAYLERLPQVRAYSISGDRLTLETSTKGTPLVYRAVSGNSLDGSWDATSYFRPGAIVSVINGTTITAAFDDGQLSGNAGCNSYSAPYKVKGSTIAIGPIASTLMACADPAVGQQEIDYLAALELARSFSLDRGQLTLLREGGTIAVTYQRA